MVKRKQLRRSRQRGVASGNRGAVGRIRSVRRWRRRKPGHWRTRRRRASGHRRQRTRGCGRRVARHRRQRTRGHGRQRRRGLDRRQRTRRDVARRRSGRGGGTAGSSAARRAAARGRWTGASGRGGPRRRRRRRRRDDDVWRRRPGLLRGEHMQQRRLLRGRRLHRRGSDLHGQRHLRHVHERFVSDGGHGVRRGRPGLLRHRHRHDLHGSPARSARR